MDESVLRKVLVDEYFAYLDILSSRGVSMVPLDQAELDKLTTLDLSRLCERLRAVARAPTGR